MLLQNKAFYSSEMEILKIRYICPIEKQIIWFVTIWYETINYLDGYN